jgi:hypothetical protein
MAISRSTQSRILEGAGEEKARRNFRAFLSLKQGKLRASKTRPQWTFIGIS